MEELYVIVMKTKLGYFLLAGADGIEAHSTKEGALAIFEDSYQRDHGAGYAESISAIINWLQYRPSVIKAKDLDWIIDNLIGWECNQLSYLSSDAGGLSGLECRADGIKEIWENGDHPRLIKDT